MEMLTEFKALKEDFDTKNKVIDDEEIITVCRKAKHDVINAV